MTEDKGYEPKTYTGYADDKMKPLKLGDKVKIVFNGGTSSHHEGEFKIVWRNGGYEFYNEKTDSYSRMNVSVGVKVEKIELQTQLF